ncbi:hypothetical protein BH23BAC1_BH23BAC1_42280 [soil metagenome]
MIKSILILFFYLFIFTFSSISFSQESAPGPIVICPGLDKDVNTTILPAPYTVNSRTAQTANFIVEYIGFTPESKNAFQYAIDIWSTRISSPIPIRVQATWTSLDQGVLGSAGATTVYRNFEGAQELDTWYPVALAEKLSRKQLNGANDADVIASFNSDGNWYLGTDGRTPARTTDFVTVVLHEIGHGIGFISSMEVEDEQGNWGISGFPLIFDHYIKNNQDHQLINTARFANPSAALQTQLTSDNIFFEGQVIANRTLPRPKLYAPSPYDIGSSISHLDERTYPPGNPNSLMTPQIATAEAIHDPGPLLLNMFAEIGWESTFIDVSRNKDVENLTAPVVIRTLIFTETGIKPETVILHYSNNGFVTSNTAQMTPTGNPNEYSVTLPAPLAQRTISYYITLNDVYDRGFSSPANAPAGFHQIRIGPDLIAPQIVHEPLEFIFVNEISISIEAIVTDNTGIRDITIEYFINQVPQPSFQLTTSGDDLYIGNFIFQFGLLEPGDIITYRIIARDVSVNVNTTFSPTSGYHAIRVRDIIRTQASYVNDFSTPSDDFEGNGFRIMTPPGFNDPAIHSNHPYEDGTNAGNQSNYIYRLLIPIIVEPQEAIMSFNEIVLVEPGEDGSVFGESEFYDYVVVEGSNDDGQTWLPLAPGYDSRKRDVWLQHYLSDMDGDNSQAVGNPSLFRRDSIDLLETFEPGEIIHIRFRLFADASVYGWGWAIDDLNIQGTPRQLREGLVIRNNPTNGPIIIEIPLQENLPLAEVIVYNIQGSRIFSRIYQNPNSRFIQEYDFSMLAPGVYILHLQAGEIRTSKRIIVR